VEIVTVANSITECPFKSKKLNPGLVGIECVKDAIPAGDVGSEGPDRVTRGKTYCKGRSMGARGRESFMYSLKLIPAALVFAGGLTFLATGAVAEQVGKAVSVRTIVTGANGELKRSDPVSRDERIKTNNTGLGQFQFIDGTKLAVGPNSIIMVDEYVLGSGNRVKKLAINTTKGALRWISGKSPSSAYEITTPTGTLGVRGTAVDLYVGKDVSMMVLLNGAARWCLPGDQTNCVVVDRPCDFIIARGGNITQPERVTGSAVKQFGADSFPFLASNRRLLPSFQLGRANCGIGRDRFPSRSGSSGPQDTPRSAPDRENRGGCDGECGGQIN
jgi:hypothetical protein